MSILRSKFRYYCGIILVYLVKIALEKKILRLSSILNLRLKNQNTGESVNLSLKIGESEKVFQPTLWRCQIMMVECELLTSLVSTQEELPQDNKTLQSDLQSKLLMKMERRKKRY